MTFSWCPVEQSVVFLKSLASAIAGVKTKIQLVPRQLHDYVSRSPPRDTNLTALTCLGLMRWHTPQRAPNIDSI